MFGPVSPGWFGAYPSEASERMRRAAEAAEEHARTCTARPCPRCERHVCACGAPYDGAGDACLGCRAKRRVNALLEPLTLSVPRRFRPALEATAAELAHVDPATGLPRVKLTPERIAKALARPRSSDLMLYGDTGMGKTSLIVAMLGALARQDPDTWHGARFASAIWLASSRARYPLGHGDPPEMADAKAASLLVLDDLGNDVPDGRNVIQEVLFRRHDDELPTWVTTGYRVEALESRYGVAVIRRMGEKGNIVELGR